MPSASPRQPAFPVDCLFIDRWSPRAFTGEPLDDTQLKTLLEAARWAPSASNSQPWRFMYAHRDTAAWQPIFETLAEGNQVWVVRAAALVAVASRIRWVPPGKTEPAALGAHAFDAGAAWASLAFQAQLAGLKAHAMGGFDRDRLRANLGVPEDHALHAVIAIGHQGKDELLSDQLRAREKPSDRLPLASIAVEGKFSFEG